MAAKRDKLPFTIWIVVEIATRPQTVLILNRLVHSVDVRVWKKFCPNKPEKAGFEKFDTL
jgi:hypothetical protein